MNLLHVAFQIPDTEAVGNRLYLDGRAAPEVESFTATTLYVYEIDPHGGKVRDHRWGGITEDGGLGLFKSTDPALAEYILTARRTIATATSRLLSGAR